MKELSNRESPEKYLAKVIGINDLIDYQEGSVVSRQIISKDAGTVTLFAFDEGEGLSEHTAPYDALVYVYNGEAMVRISGNPFTVKSGELLIMPAHKPHELKAVKRFKMMLVMIR
ncbi:MAG: cupin domain-containing protein [Spirochaetota bacterium]